MKIFAKLLDDALIDKRQDRFLYPFPESFLYYDVKINSEIPFLIKGKQVIKLRLLYQPQIGNYYFDGSPLAPSAACYITYQNGSKEVKSIAPKKLEEIHELFKQYCINSIQTFKRMDRKPLAWQENSMDFHYKQQPKNPEIFYSELHQKIITSVENLACEQHFAGLNIIDGGCGDGKLLKKMETSLKASLASIHINFMGFDFNHENIKVCEHHYTGDCKFFQGDLLHINQIIATAIDKGWLHPDWPIVLTLSGSLTRLVLDNGFQAGTVLMRAAASRVDYIIGGGVGEPLITSRMTRHIGYKSNASLSMTASHNFFSFQRLPAEEVNASKLTRLLRTNILDLSLSPYPVPMLLAMQTYLKADTTIDLSFVPLTEELIKTINILLKSNAALKLVYWHPSDTEINRFLENFFLQTGVSVKFVLQDAFLMSSQKFFTLLKDVKLKNVLDDKLVNNFILNYISKTTSSTMDDKQLEISLLRKVIVGTGKTILLEETDNEKPLVVMDANDESLFTQYLDKTVLVLEQRVIEGDFAPLPTLINWYRNGIFFRNPDDDNYTAATVGKPLLEVNFYHHLSIKHAELFNKQAMKMLALWAINTKTTPHSAERNEALQRLEQLWSTDDAPSLKNINIGP